MEPKKESYRQKSAESIKKILDILERLKKGWDLSPNEISINKRIYSQWIQDCGLGDEYELQDILETLRQEGLILSADFFDKDWQSAI